MNWSLWSLIILAITVFTGILLLEKSRFSTKQISLVATIATFAALGRVVFSPIAGFQPATFIILLSGAIMGPISGMLTGVLMTFVSNLILGHGPWTPWQMLAWGLGGLVAGLLKNNKGISKRGLLVLLVFWGFAYGLIINTWHWLAFVRPQNWQTFLTVYSLALPFDTLHSIGNVIFCLIFFESFSKILLKYRKRIN